MLSFNTRRGLPARRLATLGPAEIVSEIAPDVATLGPALASGVEFEFDGGLDAIGILGADPPTLRRPTSQRATCGAKVNGLFKSSV